MSPNNPDQISKMKLESELSVLKENQKKLDMQVTLGALIRARTKDSINEQISIVTAKKLEKQKADNKYMYAICKPDGTVTDNITEMCSIVKSELDETFHHRPVDLNEVSRIVSSIYTMLTSDQKSSCEGLVLDKELDAALKYAKLNKSPGLDGIPVEFYRKFWPVIKPTMRLVLDAAFNCNQLPFSIYEGVLTFIYKGEGNRLWRYNWRPLTLLNLDYKLLANVLTARLSNVTKFIIGADQLCSVKERSIVEGALLIHNLCYYAAEQNSSCVICCVDIKGAFDTVNWEFMFAVLNQFGFSADFIKWIRLIYNDLMTSDNQINNYLTSPIKIQRGIRQECPLSALLYVLCAEATARLVEKNHNIIGYRLPNGAYIKQTRYCIWTT